MSAQERADVLVQLLGQEARATIDVHALDHARSTRFSPTGSECHHHPARQSSLGQETAPAPMFSAE
jgi:hypothetical protein